jgi:hypothetical protein
MMTAMSVEIVDVEDLEQAVAKLSPEDLAKFRAWFEQFAADAWDRQIERDAHNGKLDKLVEKSEAEFATGRFREI